MTDTPKHKGLYSALAAAQAEMGPALKDSQNPAFKSKYADLASVMSACMPALSKHGIAVLQPAFDDEAGRYVKTIFVHGDTGEVAECRVPLIVAKNDMQGYGSAVTYARRYGLMGMAGIAPEDDDGNAAAKAPPKDEPKRDTSSDALRDAWRDGVEDSLPENATPRQKAEAYAKAIAVDFATIKKVDTLAGRWKRHIKIIDNLEQRFPELHGEVVDAYENQMMEIAPRKEEE
jgi:hypothetical protein